MDEIERARSALNSIDVTCSREEWVRIGMAVKSASLSFDDFHSWSALGANYENEKVCRVAWKSFKAIGALFTV